jgi:hypothetical protein
MLYICSFTLLPVSIIANSKLFPKSYIRYSIKSCILTGLIVCNKLAVYNRLRIINYSIFTSFSSILHIYATDFFLVHFVKQKSIL